MKRFSVVLVLVLASVATGCTLDLDDLSDLLTIRVGGEDETCLDQFETCVESGEDIEQCIAELQLCRDEEPTEPPPGEEQCFVEYEQCIEMFGDMPGEDGHGICEEQLRECLEGVDPTEPPPGEEQCFAEYEQCMEGYDEAGGDGDADTGDDHFWICEEQLRECLENIDPNPEPNPEEQCYLEFDQCIEGYDGAGGDGDSDGDADGDDRYWMCDEMLRECLENIDPEPEPNPEDQCYEEYNRCLEEFPEGSEDGWWMCDEMLRECLENIDPTEPPPPYEEECFNEYEHCIAEFEDMPDEEGRWVCEEQLNECLEAR